jgi:hypothetical protein
MAAKNNGDAANASKEYRNRFTVYEVTPGFVFCDGYTKDDVVKETRFGKRCEVIHVKASEEISTEIRRWDERSHKQKQREARCRIGNKRCDSTHCETCPFFLSDTKGGAPISLDELYEKTKFEPIDMNQHASPELELENNQLWNAFFKFMESLSPEERTLAEGIANSTPDKELMLKTGITKQSTLSSRKMKVRGMMQKAMKDFGK